LVVTPRGLRQSGQFQEISHVESFSNMTCSLTHLIEPVHYAFQGERDADYVLGVIVFLGRHCVTRLTVSVDENSVAIVMTRPLPGSSWLRRYSTGRDDIHYET
jgi:hypothetical protein